MKKNWLRMAAYIAALAFIAIGIFRGEVKQVFQKAVFICMECIGIG